MYGAGFQPVAVAIFLMRSLYGLAKGTVAPDTVSDRFAGSFVGISLGLKLFGRVRRSIGFLTPAALPEGAR
jgi:hypothetical protein